MSEIVAILIVLFAGGTFLVTLLEYNRKLINEKDKNS